MTEQAPSVSLHRDLDTHHLFAPPDSRRAWERRRADLRRQILFSAGLWPMPEKTPLRPRITGRIEGPDYTIENVAIKTLPGFYLCGNLYRPKGKKGPFPAIVNPHGHWSNGRLEMQPDVPKADPPPAPPAEGRGNLVSIGVNLARQGFIVFAYDMVGYNDTSQVDHRFAGNLRAWLWNVSLLGLQLWNSLRAVDYLVSLPDVDRRRIGATGASGGGTQTFLLCAVDDRIQAAVPVNMVSASMQGGCLCENGPGLRVGTDNVEIAAMFAPKPLLLVACTGDWTKNNPTEECPVVRKVYDLYGAGDRTACTQFNYQHNYNVESREAMYAWFGKWLLHDENPAHFRERPFEADANAMRVWNAQNPMPADALKEPELTQALIALSEKQLSALWPKDADGWKRFRETYAPALACSLGVSMHEFVFPAITAKKDRMTLLVGWTDETAESLREVAEFFADGTHGDTMGTGSSSGQSMHPVDLWDKFSTTYNRTILGQNVLGLVAQILELQSRYRRVDVVGIGEAGLPTLLARALAGGEGRTIIDTAEFDGTNDNAYSDARYAPGLRRAGDLRSAAVLCASGPLWLFNTGASFPTGRIETAYRSRRASLRIEKGHLTAAQIVSILRD